MRNIKKFLMLAMTIIPLFSSMTVNASTVSVTAKQNADYMMSTDKDGTPNWFNGVCYSNSYEDLKIAYGNNEKALYHHCLEYGFQEGRLVSPILDVAKYKKAYPDLEKAFGNNWELYVRHYFEYGIAEGRENFTGFDAQTYLNIYPDLQNAFGTDLGLATRHYIEHGLSESRIYNWPRPAADDNDSSEDSDDSDSDSSDDNSSDDTFTGEKRVDYDGYYTLKTYENGRLMTEIYYLPDDTLNMTNRYHYDANGNLFERVTTYEDGSGSAKSTYTDGLLMAIIYYDAQDAVTSTLTYEYDSNRKQIKYIDEKPDGSKEIGELANGKCMKKTEISTDGSKKVTEYDEAGNVTDVTNYDADGNVINPDSDASTPAN